MSLICGGGGAESPEDADQAKKDAAIKAEMDKVVNEDVKTVKMLLLGAGESGKSTIFKQMKIIHKDGYTKKERAEFTRVVRGNVIVSMKVLVDAATALANPAVNIDGGLQSLLDAFNAEFAKDEENLSPEMYESVKALWGNETIIKEVLERKSELQLNDSAEFYFNKVDAIAAEDYLPDTDDILRSRVRTTGIVQSDFKINSLNFQMFDVGGQRNERRKWIHCFDHVTALIFVASLSEYDQVLFEDADKNRLDEALDLFKQIVNSKWFKNTAVILFLNKRDLFEMKLTKVPMDKHRSDFPKGKDPQGKEDCTEYCKQLFLTRNQQDKAVFVHVTCATDTGNVKFVFKAVVGIILEQNMKNSGLA